MSEHTDVLGEPWVARELPLAPQRAYGPHPRAVLVRLRTPSSRRAVLYLHGFTDYFFQAHHAQRWMDAGIDFYALDMRLSGRAIGDHPRPGDVRDLHDLDEEIAAALAVIRAEGHERVVLLGHSTGGLIAAHWADRHPGTVDALVLNSPWLELNSGWFTRVVVSPLVRLVARVWPSLPVGRLDPGYGRYLHHTTGGAWEYDLAWKPFAGFPARAGFAASVRRAQAAVGRGLDVQVPVLVCCSDRSGPAVGPSPSDLASADCVLNVAHMIARGPLLGPRVTVVPVPGGVHDLALSAPPARELYESTAIAWVDRHVPLD
ncbi:alpha/beta fold hydrolase [Georgenia faecalis]|uniref:Alpha/beta fold hydrolase n=1 Tax=Georgenia faecalis TaxID=2483799 RepID=A0ABV9D4Y7_9MICO|nr:alpha/beta fold hydrolase [Georgenia faecalis]